jgi:SAM-dependent methyltransferase
MIDFASFDTRGYRTVDVRCGYGQWVSTYDETLEDAMDIELLSALRDVPWRTIEHAVDLGCGTGIYDRLVEADVASTGLESARYDLVTTCLVDEHLRDIGPLYGEACRLSRSGAVYVLVGYHPHFLMASGIPTHYDDAAGEPVAIETHVHLLSEHVTAGLGAGWKLTEMHERVVDDAWLALKPRWEPLRDQPVSFVLVWRGTDRAVSLSQDDSDAPRLPA